MQWRFLSVLVCAIVTLSYGTPVSDPTLFRSLNGALQYLTVTRPNLVYVFYSSSSTFMVSYLDADWASAEAEYRGVANAVVETSCTSARSMSTLTFISFVIVGQGSVEHGAKISVMSDSECIGGLPIQLRWQEDPYDGGFYPPPPQAPPSPDYVPGLEEPEQAPPSSDYVPGPEHIDDEIIAEDQPGAEDASPTAQSPDYSPRSLIPEAD
ncbi:putative reverse transcriptase domain-containing protein [Tanacetum coccineum]